MTLFSIIICSDIRLAECSDVVLLFRFWKPASSGSLLGVFSGANLYDSEIVNKNRSTSGSGLSPHFPSREIALVVENDLKPHE